ncbi:prolactin-like [Nothobranchius furzeri]|uniref:Prolactin-like n=2 Tax=Nothobranchius furzeri TaxID=105023 RepID=A0A9D2YZN8_NOTFU|nr:prolactin-like [Nothobranchius furzeri]
MPKPLRDDIGLLCKVVQEARAFSAVWVGIICLVFSSRLSTMKAASICPNDQTGCHLLPLANLFDRVIQHSARMHGISDDLHSEFELYFLPSKNQIGRVSRNCHTSTILTPNGKENAQRIAREELAEIILKLLVAWRDPLWHFHQSMSQHDEFTNFSSNKSLEMSDMVHELRKGVLKVVEKMQMLGIISNSVGDTGSPEALLTSDSAEWRFMKDYDLLYCFRRDSNKIQNYLKILKCRIVPKHGC